MKANRGLNTVKNTLFSIFLFGSVLLIITIIASQLIGGSDTAGGSLRSTPILATPPGYQETLSALPTREPGEGKGVGDGNHDDHPTPTINFTTYPTEDDV